MNTENEMKRDWAYLTKMTGGQPVTIQRVTVDDSDIAIEGSFELPPLAKLTAEDQLFVTAFVRSHGSIKEMEQIFGVSYPTIKGRLTRIANTLEFVAALVKAGKPYALQLHPRQLHGFRAREDRIARDRAVVEFFERTLR